MKSIHWGRAVFGTIVAEVAIIAAAFAWVAIYSYLINPGQPMATYEAYAVVSSPWVSVIAGIPIFYFVSYSIARTSATALTLFGLFLLIDVSLLLLVDTPAALPLLQIALSHISKLAASYLGSKRAEERARTVPAIQSR
ncbi:MAG: hypothetical protein KF832_00595 [Caldilineaceae bacterium]|nr:hypothetical protein [Caldilineaceae bacterium]